MHLSEYARKSVLPFTVNIMVREEREKLNQLGSELAAKEGLRYEGYFVWTAEPYSVEHAKPVLYFN
ncbi:hypothetical protein HZB08_01420 [Candidatus Saganbacteria bacterium]|uniref:Uncharacterized protein n=1 Tax=Candidatus Saganbacteria bacterium TaxID=2575572 RepID=A0A9D6UKU5_UNCSA|nr:hypothetical protein [Candidatus Saganbacteria bacterium]